MNEKLRVLVVDDHPLFRQGVVSSLNAEPDMAVIGETASGEQALAMAQDMLPDVMLLDISLPGWDGLMTAEKVTAACPATVVLMLTMWDDKDKLLAALKAGARGYVLKGTSASELAQIVRNAANGEVYVSPSLAADMLVSLTSEKPSDPLQELTVRERQILTGISAGQTNREIAETLFLSEKTIKHYVSNIFQKLQVRSRVEAALFAAQHKGLGNR
ncbi:response regulator transcription factor [Noviherbaspirillum sp. L7-7A]|uniref:response regulator n=1 Tax=Noviherbaspirillum sp. L7-7A TaxID=2850560 RepID=UPI001C2B7E8D|nr:response regulator transcription factor [Noviherbaspirillum sp. L7-7A]MBV0882167.1 response regulator transcription factor [Noviherbaspirillum sp. L7-7A]